MSSHDQPATGVVAVLVAVVLVGIGIVSLMLFPGKLSDLMVPAVAFGALFIGLRLRR